MQESNLMILIRVRDCCMYVIQLHCPVSSCRYPADPYDRFWFFQGTNSTMLQSTAPLEYLTGPNGSVLVANGLYGQPPGVALENAVSTSGTLTISDDLVTRNLVSARSEQLHCAAGTLFCGTESHSQFQRFLRRSTSLRKRIHLRTWQLRQPCGVWRMDLL